MRTFFWILLLICFGSISTCAHIYIYTAIYLSSQDPVILSFSIAAAAANAREMFNFTPINGKPMRIMFSHRDPSMRRGGHANLFVKNLDPEIDNKTLHDTFAPFGAVLSCKVAVDSNGQSKGYGFVQFDQEEAAQNAISQLNGMMINDRKIYVGLFIHHQERSQTNGAPKFTNVYVKNFSETTTDEELRKFFGKYGSITSAVVMKDGNGKSRCFGFVNFESPDAAAAAVENMNGTPFSDDKILYVGKAQKKVAREAELKAKFEEERNIRFQKLQGANLYMKNIDDSITDEKLKELFSAFGTITSFKLMVDSRGSSKGSGFVAFSTPEEATRAMNEMNGKMIGGKPLYVAVAQRKEERKAQLQAQFAQIQASSIMTPLHRGMPVFHPGAPRLAPQQLFFGQDSPGLMYPQPAAYGFQHQLLPGVRPGVAPNFNIPYQLQRQGQAGQRMGARRGGNHQRTQQQVTNHNSNQGFSRYVVNERNGADPSMVRQGLMGSVMHFPFDASAMSGSPLDVERSGPVPVSTLASALASATPESQHMILGEQLFPLVEQLERDYAGKVTGMLLEMDQTEVLHLIESPEALKQKVAEAINVLRVAAASGSEVGDQLGSLSLNE